MVKILSKMKGKSISFLCSGKCDKSIDKIKECSNVVFIPNLDYSDCDFLCTVEECIYESKDN